MQNMIEEKADQIKPVSLLSDNPAEPEQDILDYQTYCDAIVSLIKDLPSGAPFTMGIFGNWGSGKTTLLKLIKSELTKQKSRSIWVNVWKVGSDEEVWKAFLQAVLISVKEELSWYKRWLFHLGLLGKQIDWAETSRKLPELLLKIAIVVIPLYFSLINLVLPSNFYTSSTTIKVVSATGAVVGTILGWLLLLRPYLEAVNERVKVDLQGLVKTSPLKKRVSLLEEFNTFFEIMVFSLVGKKEKLTVFIDDLDRCPPERIVQVLDAIKLFLDLPNCVYLIGMDREIVEQAIASKFANYKDPKAEAREYLEKIIALPFDLPPLSGQQMQALVEGLKTNLPEPEECTRVFALGQEPNPRKVKRTINTFLLLWALANKRKELEGEIKPVRLAKLVVIQQNYRDLYLLLTLIPKSLGELEIYFRKIDPKKPESIKDLKEELPDYLKPFAENNNLNRLLTLHAINNQEDDSKNFATLSKNEYSILPEDQFRNYIRLTRSVSSTQKVRTEGYSNFINRAQEIALFRGIINGELPQQVIAISAEGGMGKTALLQQFARICKESNIPVANIDLAYRFGVLELLEDINNQLGINDPISPQTDKSIENSKVVSSPFISTLKKFTVETRGVILFDTYETILNDIERWLEENLLSAILSGVLPNVVCVLSGRRVEFHREEWYRENKILFMPVSAFTYQNAAGLFNQIGANLSKEQIEQLYEITAGHPLAMTIAADMFKEAENKDGIMTDFLKRLTNKNE